MMWLLTFAVVAALLVIAINLLAAGLLARGKDQPQPEPEAWPPVAILVAARNEAHTLDRCLAALARLNYPANKLRVWIGNDASTDRTKEVAEAFCRNRAGWGVCDIQEQWGQARGKANVLAQLAQKAAPFADYYFITDADVAVNPAWLKGLLRYAAPGVGIVNGTTVVEGKERISLQQRYDWALALGLAKAYTYLPLLGETLSAIGNNMLVSKEAYESVGGYEHIPFSVTEDFELHRQLKKKGYRNLLIARPEVKAYTLAEAGRFKLLHQRKRWMRGAMQLPLPMVAILFIQALFMPIILLLFFFSPLLGSIILLTKMLSQAVLIRKMLHRMQEPVAFPFIGYELYSLALNISLAFFYFLPVPVKWKDRRY